MPPCLCSIGDISTTKLNKKEIGLFLPTPIIAMKTIHMNWKSTNIVQKKEKFEPLLTFHNPAFIIPFAWLSTTTSICTFPFQTTYACIFFIFSRNRHFKPILRLLVRWFEDLKICFAWSAPIYIFNLNPYEPDCCLVSCGTAFPTIPQTWYVSRGDSAFSVWSFLCCGAPWVIRKANKVTSFKCHLETHHYNIDLFIYLLKLLLLFGKK